LTDLLIIKNFNVIFMKKIFLTIFIFVFVANVSAQQVEVFSSGALVIDELKQKVEKLEGNTPAVNLRSGTEENAIMDLPDAVVAQCKLYQNAPNPFNQNTQIRFYIPENVNVAQLCIYNLQGTQIKQIVVTQRGESSLWISGSELSAGMYLYALIVDGKEGVQKEMVIITSTGELLEINYFCWVYFVFVEDTLFYKGSFQILSDRLDAYATDIKLPHYSSYGRPPRDNHWGITHRPMGSAYPTKELLMFLDGYFEGYNYYYERIK